MFKQYIKLLTRNINFPYKYFLFLVFIFGLLNFADTYAAGSIPNTGYQACSYSDYSTYLAYPKDPNPNNLCNTIQSGSAATQSLTPNSTVRNNCGMNTAYVALGCTPYGTPNKFVYRLNNTICSSNSTFNPTTHQCDCATGYEPDQAGTSCVEEQEQQSSCASLPTTPVNLTVLVTTTATDPNVTINLSNYNEVDHQGCQYFYDQIPDSQNLGSLCFTYEGNDDNGYCEFSYAPSGLDASPSAPDTVQNPAQISPPDQCVDGTVNAFGACHMSCDPQSEWTNYDATTCDPKLICDENQTYFSDQNEQRCDNQPCPQGEYRPTNDSSCQSLPDNVNDDNINSMCNEWQFYNAIPVAELNGQSCNGTIINRSSPSTPDNWCYPPTSQCPFTCDNNPQQAYCQEEPQECSEGYTGTFPDCTSVCDENEVYSNGQCQPITDPDDGEGDGDGNGACEDENGNPIEGCLYEEKDKTFDDVLSQFKADIEETDLYQASNGFFNLTLQDRQCPVIQETFLAGFMGGTGIELTFDFYCSQLALDLYPIIKAVLLTLVSFVAFRWAIH